jgi:hypothetical protein
LDIFRDRLPPRPYYKDIHEQRRIIADKAEAIKHRHIQYNSPFKVSWLAFDIDRETARLEPLFVDHLPLPNISAVNPENNHAHWFYGLENPVLMDTLKTKTGNICNPRIRKHPLRYLAAVDIGMTIKLQADPAYHKEMSKNPLHDYWQVDIWRDYLWDLPELADYVDLTLFKDTRKTIPAIGHGRNCILFDLTLKYAIKEYRKSGWLSNSMFWQSVESYAIYENKTRFNDYQFNGNYGCLTYREVLNIVKSVIAWITQNHTKEGFSLRQSNRGKLSGIARLNKANERNAEIIEYKELYPNLPNRELAEMWNVSKSTVDHIRTEYGLSLYDLVNIGNENSVIGAICE